MPADTEENKLYQNHQWYIIYHKYKNVEMVTTTSKDYRLCRDIYVATINILIVYMVLSLIFDIVTINKEYIEFLIFMIIGTNLAARNKGKKMVYNVIAHDIAEKNR